MKLNRILALLLLLALAAGLMTTAQAAEKTTVGYIERAWDDQGVMETPKTANCTVVDSGTTDWGTGWYAVTGNVTVSDRITVTGDVHLILRDDCTLTAEKGITVAEGNSLTIYGQIGGTGALVATGDENCAGIGGGDGGYTATADDVAGIVIHRNSDNVEWLLIEDAGDVANKTNQPYHIVRRAKNDDGSYRFVEGERYGLESLSRVSITYGQSDEAARDAVNRVLAGPNVDNDIIGKVNQGSTELNNYLQSRLKSVISKEHEISYSVQSISYGEKQGDKEVTKYRYEIHIYLDNDTVKNITSSGHIFSMAFSDSFTGSIEKNTEAGFIKTVTQTSGYQTETKQLLLIQGTNSWSALIRNGEEDRTREYGLSIGEGSFGTPEARNSFNKLNDLDEKWFAYLPKSEEVTELIALNRIGSGETVKNGDLNGGFFKNDANGTYRFVSTVDQDGSCGTITINGGRVTAQGGSCGAGIGGGRGGDGGDVTIYGGTVKATSGKYGAGIGGGDYGDGGDVTIWGGTVAAKGSDNGEDIGCGHGGAESGSLSHKHSFTYTLSDDEKTVIAYCGVDYCPLEDNEATVSIAKPEHETYGDGKDCSAIVTGDTDVLGAPTVSYYPVNDDGTKGTALTAAPENAGKYRAEFTLGGQTAYVEYTIEKAPATVKADDNSRIYGGADPELTAKVEGMVGTETLNFELSRAKGEDVGDYAITVTPGENPNYSVSVTGGTFTINPARLTVSATDGLSKTYGDADPELTYTAVGLLGNDGITGAPVRAEGEDVGTYAIEQGTLTAGKNYTIAFKGANFTINPAPLTVTATEGLSKTYGGADPELTYTADGLLGNDGITGAPVRADGEDVGTYAIGQGTLTAGKNYNIAFKGANFTITPKAASVKAKNVEITYGDAIPSAFEAEVEDTVNGDTLDYTLACDPGEGKVGGYPITVTPGKNPNYEVSTTDGTLTIKPTDKTEFLSVIEEAEELYDRIKDDEDCAEAAEELKEAIEAARKIAEEDNVTPDEVKAAEEAISEVLDRAERRAAFEEYKDDAAEDAAELAEKDDSYASEKLIEDAVRAIDAIEYDPDMPVEEYRAAFDEILDKLADDLAEQRAKDEDLREQMEYTAYMIRLSQELRRQLETARRAREAEEEAARRAKEAEAARAAEEAAKWKNPFLDVKETDAFYDDVKFVNENGIMIGEADDLFAPYDPLERGMIVTVLYRMEGQPAVAGTSFFTDVPAGEWYSDAVEWAAASGIVNGYGDGTYGPKDHVTREQLVTILYRYAQWKGYAVKTVSLKANDAKDVSDWASEAMAWAAACGVLSPDKDGNIRPGEDATRAEIAAAIRAFLTGVAR